MLGSPVEAGFTVGIGAAVLGLVTAGGVTDRDFSFVKSSVFGAGIFVLGSTALAPASGFAGNGAGTSIPGARSGNFGARSGNLGARSGNFAAGSSIFGAASSFFRPPSIARPAWGASVTTARPATRVSIIEVWERETDFLEAGLTD